jgi:hypothetical protein
MYQLGYMATGALGVIGICVSGCWLAHIIIYMLPPTPIHPLVNDVFIKLDGVFPLFGVAAFAAFCAYLMGENAVVVWRLWRPLARPVEEPWPCDAANPSL